MSLPTELEQIVARIAELRVRIRKTDFRSTAYRYKWEIEELKLRRTELRQELKRSAS